MSEYILPDFLNRPPKSDDFPEFTKALKRYEEHFGVGVSTAELTLSISEIVDMIEECIVQDITWEEYLGEEHKYDDDTDY
ncbi:hypothetical protein MUB23_04080 [Cuneatibacter sp. NSJ-177]|mgnify:CR=1 FL=1|uniref:hypothetical protein n=1 Tax=Cuneatibacter sp. NSJ-177 TaxID=2931401 RepID=UPI001FD537C1|nr:hypothetical protein [Cuneatibacter sp. NSJ-177]MCJ7834572.1 hypothetical protein [Cuneatibacter sp. NSJ-177]